MFDRVLNTPLRSMFVINKSLFNPFVPNMPFFYPLKTSENLTVFYVFRGQRKGALETNGLSNKFNQIFCKSSVCWRVFDKELQHHTTKTLNFCSCLIKLWRAPKIVIIISIITTSYNRGCLIYGFSGLQHDIDIKY